MDMDERAGLLAQTLRDRGTLTQLVGDFDPRELFELVRAQVPCVGVISRTGNTLHLGLVTEDVRTLAHNDRINLATHYGLVGKVHGCDPGRVWR